MRVVESVRDGQLTFNSLQKVMQHCRVPFQFPGTPDSVAVCLFPTLLQVGNSENIFRENLIRSWKISSRIEKAMDKQNVYQLY